MFGNSRNRAGAKSGEQLMQSEMDLANRIFIPAWAFDVFVETISSVAPVSASGWFFVPSGGV